MSLSGPHVREIEMSRPTKADAEALAAEVLAESGGPVHLAADIAAATFDSPLVTVVGSQLVARDRIHPSLVGNVADFQTLVTARLKDVIAGDFATRQDASRMQGVLRIVSLVQPVLPDEPNLVALLAEVEGINQPNATRLLRMLTEAGVLFRRGLRYRLSPDLLADSIISQYCINQDGSSNGYIERVFDLAQPQYLRHLFVNLGRLDWRLQSGDTTNSRLLDGLWGKLRWQDYDSSHVEAAAAVAAYQPRRALDFARRLVSDGHGQAAHVCDMIRNAAYNLDFVEEACELLWRTSRDDERPLHQHPRHGVRILKELAEFEPNKPVEYIARVVDFAIQLLTVKDSLSHAYTPFTILEGALSAEGHSTTATSRRAITVSTYATDLAVVASVRARIIDTLLNCIENEPPQKAFLAARAIGEAVRSRITSVQSEVNNGWHEERAQDDRAPVRGDDPASCASGRLSVRAAESVAWQAFHGSKSGAANILALLDRDLDTRFVRALMDGWGHKRGPSMVNRLADRSFEIRCSKLLQDVQASFSDPSVCTTM